MTDSNSTTNTLKVPVAHTLLDVEIILEGVCRGFDHAQLLIMRADCPGLEPDHQMSMDLKDTLDRVRVRRRLEASK
jgi:hypothetical protein